MWDKEGWFQYGSQPFFMSCVRPFAGTTIKYYLCSIEL